MEKIVACFNNPVWVSTFAAAVSAVCALLTFLYSRKPSRRDRVDILKLIILEIVSFEDSKELWQYMVNLSKGLEGGGVGPKVNRLAEFIATYTKNKRYRKEKWLTLIPVACRELIREGYGTLLRL